MSTAVFYSLSNVCQHLTLYRFLVLCHYVHCCLLESVHCMSVPHTTVCWLCVTMSTAVFYSLSTVCLYLTLYRLLVMCHYVHCCLLQPVHCRSVPHTVQSVGSVSLCPQVSSTVCPLSVSTTHCTVCWFCVTMSTADFYSLSTVCQYHTLYSLLVLCHCVHCCLLQSVHCLSVPHTVPSVRSVSLFPLLSSTVCPLFVSSTQCTVCWFCVTMSTAVFFNLFTVCQYLTLYSLLVLCHYVYCYLLQSVHCLSVPHTVPFVGSVCPFSVSTSHSTVYWFFITISTAVFYSLSTVCQYHTLYSLLFLCLTMSTAVFYSLSTVCQYLTLYRVLVLCLYFHCCLLQFVHCCLLRSVHCLSVAHTVPSVGSVSICPQLFTTVCPLSVRTSQCTVCPLSFRTSHCTVSPMSASTSHCTLCWFCVTTSTATFYSLSTACQHLTLYRLLVLCHYVHCCLLRSVQCLSVPHTVQSFGSVPLCAILQPFHCLAVHHTVQSLHCLSVSHILQSVRCLSVPHTVKSV